MLPPALRKLVPGRLLSQGRRIRSALGRRRRKVFAALAVVLLLAVAATVVTRSWLALFGTLVVVIVILAGTAFEVRRGQRALQSARAEQNVLRDRLSMMETSQAMLAVTLYERAVTAGEAEAHLVPGSLVPVVVHGLVERSQPLEAYRLASQTLKINAVDPGTLRRLRNELRRRGYLTAAREVAHACARKTKSPGDKRERAMIDGEFAVLSGAFVPTIRAEDPDFTPRPRRVLHVVGNSLPVTQSGYTLRTHYTALAQREAGLDPVVVTHMGFGHDGEDYARDEIDGITYHRVPGPARGTEPLDIWMRRHVQRVANVVRVARPAVLHAASDFLNALTAQIVGREFGIPVVYESRGFWEETWLSRQAQTYGWTDLPALEARFGLPDVYVWRREIEDRCRREAAHVVTLADVMADRVETGGVPRERITVVPNGVDVDAFPVLTRDQDLAAQLGIAADATVIGYISSIVEYEGIDTLIEAYAALRRSALRPVKLLIVGDGLVKTALEAQAARLGLDDVIFTGRVAHDQVLSYYGLIDIFVVPRKPVEVCHLVTPLKPFEAFSTGRTVVLSNVRALARIAEQSGAAETFEAGDAESLAAVLTKLIGDADRRAALARAGAEWVRAERTWAANAATYIHVYEQIGAITTAPVAVDPAKDPRAAARAMVARGDVLDAYALLEQQSLLPELRLSSLRQLRNELRARGYLGRALVVANVIGADVAEQDRKAQALIEGEIAVLSGRFVPSVAVDKKGYQPREKRVLHIVGNSLPHTQSGYTLRTHYTVLAQRDAGLEPFVVTHMGFGHNGEDYAREEVDGITYHRVPGPARGTEPLDSWLRTHVQRVANVVRVVRPVVLHAASDFLNALTAVTIGRAYGIPVVYEARGFWEETWLSRQAGRFGWTDVEALEAMYGLPDTYVWRRDIENRLRLAADRVVTLAPDMAERIEGGGVAADRVTVVPNGVDVDAFPVLTRDQDLAAQLGIAADTTVIGYISSIVEYEGIDTLIEAYAAVRGSAPGPVKLLIVGDGPVRDNLMRQAERLGLHDAIFTGRVAHDQVLSYYGLIDIFVVPRKPVEVCHLVTPLKPFEAFSTGRTVVLSNVRALARIAEQSGAAETFEAGDAQSLAEALAGLLSEPARRGELAEAGSTWVRTHRTWAANAGMYLRLYEDMEVVPRGELSVPEPSAPAGVAVDIEELRRQLTERSPIPLEVLYDTDTRGSVEKIMTTGWAHGEHPAVDLSLPIDWTTLCISNRSWNFSLHAWDFLAPVLRAYADTGERQYLDWCVERAVSWARTFNEGDARGTMAWYDMSLGLRAYRLAYIIEQVVVLGFPSDVISTLIASAARHQREFLDERIFNPRNNHGVYLALGQLAFARRLSALPGMDSMQASGRERLSIVTRTQFGADGGHLEHSPAYHRMLLNSFRGGVAAGLLEEDEVRNRIILAEDVLGWFIQPNGELVQVGDSPATKMRSAGNATTSPFTEFHISRGKSGRPTESSVRVLDDAGYAIVRHPQPRGTKDHESASYLMLAGGFHSRTHKQADDLSVTWFDRGHELLIDAGRYGYVDLLPEDSPLRLKGYFYSAPERQFVEATRAHNTAEADATDHVRRGRKPFGSAIRGAQERDGHFRIWGEVDHGTWRHKREMVLRPGHWLAVTDVVTSQDDAPHDFRVWWNMPEEVQPEPLSDQSLQVGVPGSDEPLWIREFGRAALIRPVSGQREPVLRGWRSKVDLRFTPAWSFGFEALAVREHTFRTLLTFSQTEPQNIEANPFDELP